MDHANYKTQVMGMQIFVTFFSLFNDNEKVKIVDSLLSDKFGNSKYYLWYLEKTYFDFVSLTHTKATQKVDLLMIFFFVILELSIIFKCFECRKLSQQQQM